MMRLEAYVAGFRGAITDEDLGGKTIRMDIDGVGCIHISGTTISTEKAAADCILTTTHDVYDRMYSGVMDPTIAFGKGDLELVGDMTLALKMPSLFARASNR